MSNAALRSYWFYNNKQFSCKILVKSVHNIQLSNLSLNNKEVLEK